MVLALPVGIAAQNVFNNYFCFVIFVLVALYLGAAQRLLLAFLLASIASALHSLYINRLSAQHCV